MTVDSIYDELKSTDVLGVCDSSVIFSRLTDAVSLISNQGILDPNIGEMDLCVCDGCVTLPWEVGTVLAVNQSGNPTVIRDQWYQYHINGMGSTDAPSFGYTDELGQVSTFKDPSEPVYLVAEVESAVDSNKAMRVFGWDVDGKRIYTEGSDGTLQDGFLVPTVYGFSQPNPSAPAIARFDRVQKVVTNGFVRLLAINSDGTPHTLIGYYRPEETNPSYRRIRVACHNWARIKYRKRDIIVRSRQDWINIENREVLILAVKAVNYRRKNNVELASMMEAEAVRLLNNEANAKKPPSLSAPQITNSEFPCNGQEDTLFY